jgi:hypothetical protein
MFDFTKQLAGLLIVGAVFFSACNSSETTPTDRVALSLHQSARVGADVTVRADSIQDSRCPKDVTCIWAGQANVKLLLSKDSDSTTVRLALGPDMKEGYSKRLDSTNVSLSNTTYKVILREVNPFPTSSNADQPRTAIVQVTKL